MTTITIDRTLLEQALDALNCCYSEKYDGAKFHGAKAALRAALAAQRPAPAWHDAPEREAFEAWTRTPPPENWWKISAAERLWLTWQAACAWRREKDATLCEQLGTSTNGIYERNQECADKIRSGE